MPDDDAKKLPAIQQEVLPPERNIHRDLVAHTPSGLIENALSGFMATLQARTVRRHADRHAAQKELLDSRTAVADSHEKLMRRLGRLADLPEILAEDQRARDEDRRAALEQRSEAEHQRLLADHRRARERDDLAFIASAANARHRAALHDALKAATEAERMSDAAARISDDEIDRLYNESAAKRIEAEFHYLIAEQTLAKRRGDTISTPDDDKIFARVIELTEHQIELYRARGIPVEALLDLLAHFNADRAATKSSPA